MFGAGGGGGGKLNPPPPPLIFYFKVATIYAPLALPSNLHDLPDKYMKSLPKFTREGDLIATEHVELFDQFVDILGIKYEDVYMILFIQNFDGQVRIWFRGLPANSITTYDQLEMAFLRKWGENKDHLYYLIEFGALRKKNSKTVYEFIQIFNKLYSKIPFEVKPSQPAAKVTFARVFDSDFALLLWERIPTTLVGMQDDAIKIESNMME